MRSNWDLFLLKQRQVTGNLCRLAGGSDAQYPALTPEEEKEIAAYDAMVDQRLHRAERRNA